MPPDPTAEHRPLPALLRTLLIACALLAYALAASSHDHDSPRSLDHGLCAVCVYGAGGGATLETAVAPAPPQVRGVPPVTAEPASVAVRSRLPLVIRGPPLHA